MYLQMIFSCLLDELIHKSQAMGDKNKSRGRKRKRKRQMKEGQFRPRPVSQPDDLPAHTEGSASKRKLNKGSYPVPNLDDKRKVKEVFVIFSVKILCQF